MKKKHSTKKESTTAKNLEKKFDEGESVLDYFETENKRVGVACPLGQFKRLIVRPPDGVLLGNRSLRLG